MTVFAREWDVTYEAQPPGSQAANQMDTRLQEVKVDVRERMEVEHYMDYGGTEPEVDGVHMFPAKTLTTRDAITDPKTGQMVVRSDTRSIDIYDGSDWIEFMAWKTGDMKMAAYDDATQPGWVKADGTSYLRTGIYANLYALIGIEYGSVDGTHFNVPDMSGKMPIGIDSGDADFDAMGETGGDKTKTIAEANLPAHTHDPGTLSIDADGIHDHDLTDTQETIAGTAYIQRMKAPAPGPPVSVSSGPVSDSVAHTHGISGTSESVGDGTAQDVMNPFITMQWYIKL